MTRPRLVVLTNIPSPYRIHEFNILSAELGCQDIDFRAIFLATTERGRHWTFEDSQCHFDYQLWSGGAFSWGGRPVFFNPRLIAALIKMPPTWLWLGGSWYYPTNLGLSWLMPKSYILGWNESTESDHHALPHHFHFLRRLLLRAYHGWVVPGERARDYAHQHFAVSSRPILQFANTVDEQLYQNHVAALRFHRDELRQQWGIEAAARVALWVARLAPEKGIIPFLKSIAPLTLDYRILIAGEGDLRPQLETWLAEHPQMKVSLLGHQSADKLVELYALADFLLLPSLSEPYGFVAVEALWAGLPLMLSKQVGAIPEVLSPHENGWLLDSSDPDPIRAIFSEAITADPATLKRMGEASLNRARQNFSSQQAAQQFIAHLRDSFPPKEAG